MTPKRSKSRRARAVKSREFCVVHPNGRVSDAELHEPILEQGDRARATEIAKNVARRADLSEEEIKKLYD